LFTDFNLKLKKEVCMKKLLCIVGIVVLSFLLVNADTPNMPTGGPVKAVPGKSFGAGRGLSTTSTDGAIEVTPELKIVPKSEGAVDPLASGAGPKGGATVSKVRALSDVIDSLDLPNTMNNGNEWNGRYIYIVEAQSVDSSIIRVLDPENSGSLVDEWELPFIGAVMGIAFVNNSMYVSDWTNGMIRKINPTTHALIASFSAPGGTNVRGMTSDGEYLYMGAAGSVDSIYQTDTLGNRINEWYIGSFCDWVMDLAIDTRDSTMWLTDDDTRQIMKVDASGSLLEAFTPPGNPGTNYCEGISFDGSDLWFNTYYGDKLYRIDGGHSRSRIALFQDHEPWGYRSIKDILYDNGIPFKQFGTADIGKVDLSIYTKAIIAGQQYREMGDTIAANKTWWENWISNGGVLQISGATQTSQTWEGLTLPGDFSCVNNLSTLQNLLEIASSWHPLVNQPHVINDDSLDNWSHSSHGYITGLTDNYTVVQDTASRPVLAIKRLGDGGIIATQMTLEFAWGIGYCPILENVIKYWQYGVSKNVLFAISDSDVPWMRNALMARDTLIGNVDYMNGTATVPKVKDFLIYDVILTYPNYSFSDEVAMGDTLAAFVDLGRRSVITGGWCWYSLGNDLQGAIMDTTYNPFYSPSGDNHYATANLGWYDAGHLMMDGISTFSEEYRDYLQVSDSADTVAKYDDGEYLLGYKKLPSGGIVVGFNAVPGDTLYYGWDGQMVKLLANIINWSAENSGIEDMTEVGDGLMILNVSNPILRGKEWLTLSIDSPVEVKLSIINIAGRVVSSKSLNYTTSGVKKVEFDVSELSSGAYFLSLKTPKNKAILKAVVIK
jgi:hypothetical protein